MTRWLTDDEQGAWRALVAVVLRLPGALEAQLQRDDGLTHFEYWVMALLSEMPDRRGPLAALAATAEASLSRMSHVVTRLQSRGLVDREPHPEDRRTTLAVLTDEGWAVVRRAAPGHVAAVRRLVFDGMDAEEVAVLERVCRRVAERLDEEG